MIKTEFTKNVATVFTGQTIAQIAPLIAAPFIGRLYSPEDYAFYQTYMSIGLFFLSAGSFRFDAAIILAKSHREAFELLKLVFKSLFVTLSLVYIGTLFFGNYLERYFETKGLKEMFLWVLPIAVFANVAFVGFYNWLNRLKKYKILSGSRIVQQFGVTGGNLLFGFAGFSGVGLVLAHCIGVLISAIPMAYATVKTKELIDLSDVKPPAKALIKKYRAFPLVSTPQTILDNLFAQLLLTLAITKLFGLEALGLFFFALRYSRMPVRLFAQSVAGVYYQELSEQFNIAGDTKKVFRKTSKLSLLPAVSGALVLFLLAEWLFPFVFGSQWTEAGLIGKYLAPTVFCLFMVSPIAQTPLVYGKQKQAMLVSLLLYSGQILALYFGWKIYGTMAESVLVYSLVSSALYLGQFMWYRSLIFRRKSVEIKP